MELSEAEERARQFRNLQVRDDYVVRKLTPELMDEYVERVEVYSKDDIGVIWK